MSQSAVDICSGNRELDQILSGGFTSDRIYLIEGSPGTGKTTLGIEFLLEGARRGERGLYVTLSESAAELEAVAESHGWSLDGIEIYELLDPGQSFQNDSEYTMFEPAEVELGETSRVMLDRVLETNPKRIVIDSLSEFRMLSQSGLRFRRQILALKQFFAGRSNTVLLLDDMSTADHDLQLHSLVHGVIHLDSPTTDFGSERRRLRVVKFRGKSFQSGYHDYTITQGGLSIFPRIAYRSSQARRSELEPMLSGNAELDALLCGGINPGSSTLMLGPAGVGKSTCATMFALEAARRGERALIYAFDESPRTLVHRAYGLGMDLEPLLADGSILIEPINPGEITPGQFANRLRRAVDDDDDGRRTSVVVIDSLNGYLGAMPEERFLQVQMHELLAYLGSRDIATFLVVAQHGMLGTGMQTPVDASYLADTVLLFRYFEAGGSIRQAISVVKKRNGKHERTIRELQMRDGKVVIGTPLSEFRGILAGTPVYQGPRDSLLEKRRSKEQTDEG